MKSIMIEPCTEGYLVWDLDENGLKTKKEVYAVSKDKLVQKVKELLGITDKKPVKIYAKLRLVNESDKPKGQEEGSCDDITFDLCANNAPDNCKHCVNQSRYENKKKIAAQKPGAPLLKASMGV